MCVSLPLSVATQLQVLFATHCRSERIAANTLIEFPGETDLSVIVVASGGENFIVTNASQAESVTVKDIERCISFAKDDILLLQGNLLPEPSLHAAKRAKEAKAKVIFNPAPYRDWCRTLSANIDVLILNSVEAARWTGTEDLERAVSQLAAPLVIVTRGPDGCLLKDGSGEVLAISCAAFGFRRHKRRGRRIRWGVRGRVVTNGRCDTRSEACAFGGG